jgi:protein required for attachment to host cells
LPVTVPLRRARPALGLTHGTFVSSKSGVRNQNNVWILVANRADAKLLEGAKELRVLRSIEHPEGRLKPGEINSDRSGLSFQRRGTGASSLDKAHDPTDQVADRFAHRLAGMLHDEGARNAFDRLVLIAEPRFLGKLRENMERSTLARVDLSISGDIAGLGEHELRAEVSRLLASAAQQ